MERRTFLKGAFGFVGLVALTSAGAAVASSTSNSFVTPAVENPELCPGPAMQAGIELVNEGDGARGMSGSTHLFNVDATGAKLIRLADGSRTIDELADTGSIPLNPADVASFFVTLGQSGYLANTVLVNLTENVV